MTHHIKFTISTKPTVSPEAVQEWLRKVILDGLRQNTQLGSVTMPEVHCDEYKAPEPQPEPTPEEWIKQMRVHPTIVEKYLTNPDGSLRIPYYEEWAEDYGLGYADRLAWEKENKTR